MDLWVAPLDLPAADLDRLAAALGAGERRRAARYRSPADARRFTAARGWLRLVLGAVLGVEPAAVPVSEGAGKPHLPAGGPPRFNVSHSGELVVAAVAPFEVGVDVEHARAGRRWADVVALACAPEEVEALAARPGDEREDGLLALWTAKEAYLKATGEGLAVDPRRVVVGRPAPGRAAAVTVDGAPTG
ncbi:MAG: 4'-phosphopantetheinyl transferase family protein, partial [Acidimicrobiales bacterium]